ncbi:hypothetical protein VaNZ11_010130, partial [Volvox africanus]
QRNDTMSHAASLRSCTTEDSLESTLQAIQEEQLLELSRLRAVRSRLHNCNDALLKVLIALRAVGAEVARDMRGMREDMDAAYAVLGCAQVLCMCICTLGKVLCAEDWLSGDFHLIHRGLT